MNRESEIKINLGDEPNYRRLLETLVPKDVEIRQENYFFDSDESVLLKSRWALRVRIEKGGASLTLKGPEESGPAGLTIRPELIAEISEEKARYLVAHGVAQFDLPDNFREFPGNVPPGTTLGIISSFINFRVTVPWPAAGHDLKLEIDRTLFVDQSIDYELEAELPDSGLFAAALDDLRRLLSSLKIPLVFQMESKFARALKKPKRGQS
ncbi:hypothetical protein TRIP_C20126 [Candidatus Zixiibacteriota bacterium]|nr:hypothetical protein TRIP_C20126 [candidate division Zixibacteria bacterium]